MPSADISFKVESEQTQSYQYTVETAVKYKGNVSADKASVTVDKAAADAGTTVTVSITPADGYELGSIEVVGKYGTKVDTVQIAGGKTYTFVMPSENVTVTVNMVDAGTPAEGYADSLAVDNKAIHINNAVNSTYNKEDLVYKAITFTGSAFDGETYGSVGSLEALASKNNSLSYYQQNYSVLDADGKLTNHTYTGYVLADLLTALGAKNLTADIPVTFEDNAGNAITYKLGDITSKGYNSYDENGNFVERGLPCLLIFGADGVPLTDEYPLGIVFGQKSASEQNAGKILKNLTRFVVGEDVHYTQHCYAPYDDLERMGGSYVIDLNVYVGDKFYDTYSYSVKDLEKIANSQPASLYRSYYIVDIYDYGTESDGTYTDYYEGINIADLLKYSGIPCVEGGTAQFYTCGNNAGDVSAKTSLSYLAGNGNGDYSDYVSNCDDAYSDDLNNVEPILAYSKNGYPLVYLSSWATDYNYRGPIIAVFPQNKEETAVADGGVAVCFCGKVDIQLPAGTYMPDYTDLDEAIAKAEAALKQYPNAKQSDKDSLQAAIDSAKALHDKANVTEQELKTAVSDLNGAVNKFINAQAPVPEGGGGGGGGGSAVEPEPKPEPTPEPTPEPNKFDGGKDCVSHGYLDVNTAMWYHEAVDYAVSHNLFKGNSDTEFAPNADMTRGMLVTVLARYEEANGGKISGGSNKFTDVAAGAWYEAGVVWAANAGIVNGISTDLFAPNDKISREQLVAMLYRYADYLQLNTKVSDKVLSFNDSDKVSSYAVDAVKWAVENGIVNGKENNNFDPSGSASRAEVAAVLMRFAEFAQK